LCAETILLLVSLQTASITIPAGAVDLCLGPSGSILCLGLASPELLILSADGSETASWDLDGTGLPVAVAARGDGSFLVCDASAGIAVLFDHRAEAVERMLLPTGSVAIAWSGADVWCFSPDEEAVYSVSPVSGRIASAPGFRPADLSMDGRRAVLSSGAGSFLVEPGSPAVPVSTGPACLAGGALFAVRGDSLFDTGTDELVFAGAGAYDRIEGAPDGRILLWRSGSTEAVLLE
jgi:hypothetical protein